uniref:Uncharacterized protein n=1 Tax=Arundo donax TaxID=35708 RepID=A0A0A9C6F6_ARUDO
MFNPDHQVAPDNFEAVQQIDCDPNQPLKKAGIQTVQQMDCDAACMHTSEPSRSHEIMSGIIRIVPSDADVDADYWFASDPDVSVTDAWGT